MLESSNLCNSATPFKRLLNIAKLIEVERVMWRHSLYPSAQSTRYDFPDLFLEVARVSATYIYAKSVLLKGTQRAETGIGQDCLGNLLIWCHERNRVHSGRALDRLQSSTSLFRGIYIPCENCQNIWLNYQHNFQQSLYCWAYKNQFEDKDLGIYH